jgi:hypothetical protein
MALVREQSKPKEREKHAVTPIHGEWGRYSINSASAAKKGLDEVYIVDVLEENETLAHGKITGTCGCKGYQVRGTCSHLVDAKEFHEKVASVAQAATLGFDHVPNDKG